MANDVRRIASAAVFGLVLFSPVLSARDALQVLDALVRAYPDKVSSLALRDGDWSVLVHRDVYYWADGRMLTADLLPGRDEFRAYSFRPYPKKLPQVRNLDSAERKRLETYLDRREDRRDLRHPGFIEALWGMGNAQTAEETVVQIAFLGHRVRIHPDITGILEEIEAELVEAAKSDANLAKWVSGLAAVGGYVWRDIAGSANRSLHSYGIAIDLVPADYGGKQAYWRWARDFFREWWAIPHENRYKPPETVIAAFEKRGFAWGAKWFLFDQIHFEYRPELMLLAEKQ